MHRDTYTIYRIAANINDFSVVGDLCGKKNFVHNVISFIRNKRYISTKRKNVTGAKK